jgi:hypothetical protein
VEMLASLRFKPRNGENLLPPSDVCSVWIP